MSEANYEPDTSEVSQCDCRAFFVTRERGSNPPPYFFLWSIWAEGRDRTGDLRFTIPPLYQLSYLGNFFLIRSLASCARLLAGRSFLPLPLFKAAYVGDSESQFGHTSRKLFSTLFRQLPSIWSATRGTIPDFWLIFDQPHKQHLFPYFSRKYCLIWVETTPSLCRPTILPAFHSAIYCLCWYLNWHVLLQYLYPARAVSLLHARQAARGFFGLDICTE